LPFILFLMFAALTTHAGEFPDSWIWDDTPETRAPHAALEGKPMPALKLTGWLNGKVTADAMKGKVVMLDFYATWCPTCITDIPHNNALYEKYKDKGLVMIGVCTSDHGLEDMPEMVRVKKMKYPTALDPKLAAARTWSAQNLPTYALIDRKGIVRVVALKPERLEEVIQKLLAEPPPA
jgi:thiol-disulfide isomerase/thioredoxin